MKINKIEPRGYCQGVKNALAMAQNVLKDSSYPQPIYFLGSIIHNHEVVRSLEKNGAVIVDQPQKSRLELLDRIEKGTVVFSAHGVSPAVWQKAREKGLHIVDTTCANVKIVHQKMKQFLQNGYECCYIGTKYHPECEGVLGISSRIHLIEKTEDIENLTIQSPKIYITNQTTLSMMDTRKLYEMFLKKFPLAIIDNRICNATTLRQKAVYEQEPVDLCIIVGDASSSNSKKLVEVAKKRGIPSMLIENADQLKNIVFSHLSSISISSGASTPEEITDTIIQAIKEKVR